jgi:hypothetical protein
MLRAQRKGAGEQFFHHSVLVSVEAIWDWLIIASYL